ncbi:hypothetical protein AGRO_0725 [Agrobacterium sp. ATCC 31749]|nr:hypothetical protein AGRO_0725 [Agrobacterium sp. ATCC 31749]
MIHEVFLLMAPIRFSCPHVSLKLPVISTEPKQRPCHSSLC